MKKFIALAALALLLLSLPAQAQIYPIPDGLGIYFDTDATQYCLDAFIGRLEIYLMLTNCSEPTGISGWECHVTYNVPPDDVYMGWWLPDGSLNLSIPPDFVVGLGTPRPNAPIILLAKLYLFVFPDDPIVFYVGPADLPSLPGVAVYAAGGNPGHLIQMHPTSGDTNTPVAAIFACGDMIDATETTTFGHVKVMFR